MDEVGPGTIGIRELGFGETDLITEHLIKDVIGVAEIKDGRVDGLIFITIYK